MKKSDGVETDPSRRTGRNKEIGNPLACACDLHWLILLTEKKINETAASSHSKFMSEISSFQ
jgi:hypothetical protein